jgi:DNA polymerase (family 10)
MKKVFHNPDKEYLTVSTYRSPQVQLAMKNAKISAILLDIAYLLNIKKENIFKIKAYEKVAKAISKMDEDVEQLARENRLREIPGVGDAIEKKITELVTTGKLEYYEKLKAEVSEAEKNSVD